MRYGECGNATDGEEGKGDGEGGIEGQLGLEDMAGTWTMSGIIMFLGAMLQVVQSIMFRGKGAAESAESAEEADEGDIGVTADVGVGFVEGDSDLDNILKLVDEMAARMAEIEGAAGAGKPPLPASG